MVYEERCESHDALLRNHKMVADPQDVRGFIVADNKFVSRYEAADIAFKSGQMKVQRRELFSGDFDYDGRPKKPKPTGKRWPTKRKLF